MEKYVFFFFKQKTAYEIGVRLVGSEMCIRDRFETFEYDVLSNCEKRRNIIIFDNKYNRRIRVCKDLKQ